MELTRFSRFGPACLAAVILACAAAGAWTQGVTIFPPPGGEDSGEHEMQALAAAYPDRISEAARRDGDWAVNLEGQWFSWAHGRILPDSQRSAWKDYGRFRFYPYPLGGMPPLAHFDAETQARLQMAVKDAELHPPRRSEAFLARLYDAASRRETERHIVMVHFQRFPVWVNSRIAGPLKDVSAEVDALRARDPQVAAFISRLYEIDGYNYRFVDGTRSRSYHSYGLAVDLIPRRYGGKAAYWRWVMNKDATWWDTPYDERWMVPLSIVSAFEKHGFVWGGKWLFFDTMHFEYRPEILILAGRQANP